MKKNKMLKNSYEVKSLELALNNKIEQVIGDYQFYAMAYYNIMQRHGNIKLAKQLKTKTEILANQFEKLIQQKRKYAKVLI